MKKKIKIVVITIILIVIVPFSMFFLPIKYVETDLKLNSGSPEELIEGETKQIYVTFTPDNSTETWRVQGKEGVLFSGDKTKFPQLIITGNFPKKINYDLLPGTIFVLNGKYYIKDLHNINYINSYSNQGSIGCFEVESWSVLGTLQRKTEKYLPKSYLTISDYLAGEVIPVD